MNTQLLDPEIHTTYKEWPGGILVPDYYQEVKKPIAFDFFAGCGGFSLGLMQAGFNVIGACEMGTDAAHTYMVNLGAYPMQIYYSSDAHQERLRSYFEKELKAWKKNNKDNPLAEYPISGSGWRKANQNFEPGVKNFFFGDIRELNGAEISQLMGIEVGELDLIVGGPPCQGYSKAGRQATNDPRNSLVFEYARMLVEMQPKTFVMEEVPAILEMRTPQGVPVIDQFLRIIEDGNLMSYEAGMKALDIREKDIGKKLKYVVIPKRSSDNIIQENKDKKKPTPPADGIVRQIARACKLKVADYAEFIEAAIEKHKRKNNVDILDQADIRKIISLINSIQ